MNTPIRAAAALSIACLLAASARADDGSWNFSIGIDGHERTTLADVGLPGYPGATPYSEGNDDKSAVSLAAWAGAFGLRVNALKFRVADSPAQVADFYAQALAQHGAVIDCREPAARAKPPKGSDQLSCGDGAPKAGEYEYRVGTGKRFRVVHVKPYGDGARFDIARVELRG